MLYMFTIQVMFSLSKDVNVLQCQNSQFDFCWQKSRYRVDSYSIP